MYISGSKNTFELRIHQLTTSSGDLQSFKSEYNLYTGNTQLNLVNRWSKEIIKKEELFIK